MTTWITICDTCKHEGHDHADATLSHGEILAKLIEDRAADTPLKTRRFSCLMGCPQGCNITIQANGKMAYTLGRFAPDTTAAAAVVDYASMHAASDKGLVPYRQWPEGVKGHFVTRHQPVPEDT